MKYNILIKKPCAEFFRFYQENGQKYETENLEDLTNTYNKILESLPTSVVIPMHALNVKLNTEITGCGSADEEISNETENI